MADYGSSRSIVDRMRGAAALDVATYEEVEADVNATGQAAIVVVIAAIAAGLGAWHFGPSHIIRSVISELLGWASWAAITHFIGTRFFGGNATWGELLRTLGFAKSPGVLFVLGIIPLLGAFVFPIVSIWMLVAGVIAIRQALDVDTGKAILTAVVGWVVMMVIHWALNGF